MEIDGGVERVCDCKWYFPDDWRYLRVDPRDHICLRDVGRSGGLDVRGQLELGLGWSFESDAGARSLKLVIDFVDCTVYISVINVVQNTAARTMSISALTAVMKFKRGGRCRKSILCLQQSKGQHCRSLQTATQVESS